jgi:hypothetical protein
MKRPAPYDRQAIQERTHWVLFASNFNEGDHTCINSNDAATLALFCFE